MCGIAGVVNFEKNWTGLSAVNDYMQQAAITGVLRGMDSTGMFQVQKNGEVNTIKLPYDGSVFVTNKRVQAALKNVDGTRATIIHHRAATHGEVSQDNAHPFEYHSDDGKKKIIGVHNGTLYNHPRREDGLDFPVDSMYLMYQILKVGAPEALGNAKGAWAVVWADTSEDTINLATNADRPLFFAPVKDKNAMLIASEAGMLYWLAQRNRIEIEELLYPTKDMIYTFNPKSDVRTPTVTKIAEARPVAQSNFTNRVANWVSRNVTGGSGSTATNVRPNVVVDHKGTATVISPTTTTSGTRVHPHNFLESTGLKMKDEVEFIADTIFEPNITRVPGMAVVHRDDGKQDLYPAMIVNSNANINVLLNDCQQAMCRVYGSGLMPMKRGEDPTACLVLEKPSYIVSSDGAKLDPEDLEVDTSYPKHEVPFIPGPNGQLLTLSSYTKTTARGCAVCGSSATIGDAVNHRIEWLPEEEGFLCQRHAIKSSVAA